MFIAVDGGEPEDQFLCRDWKWVVTALNKAFLSSLGVLPFFGLVKTKDKENLKGLPVVEFENRAISNYKELLGNKDEVLVWVNKETPLSFMPSGVQIFGELLMTKETSGNDVFLKKTKNTEITLSIDSCIWARIKENKNVS